MKIMSSKTSDGKIFPPYIPFVGIDYERYRILVYSTAQNIGFDKALASLIKKLTPDRFWKPIRYITFYPIFWRHNPQIEKRLLHLYYSHQFSFLYQLRLMAHSTIKRLYDCSMARDCYFCNSFLIFTKS